MRSVRPALVGLGTLIILLTFVGFATFSTDGVDPRSDSDGDEVRAAIVVTADAGATTGRVTAFVFANQLLSTPQPEESPAAPVFDELDPDPVLALTRSNPSPSSTSTSTTQPPPTTTTEPPPTTTTTEPPPTTTTTKPPPTTTTTEPPPTTTTTEPPPTTTTPPSGGRLLESEMRALASQYFPAAGVDKAVLVARCESGYDPSAYNPNGPYGGLYQHTLLYWDGRAASAGWGGASIYDAAANTAVTAWLVARDGWGHWPYCSSWADGQLGG